MFAACVISFNSFNADSRGAILGLVLQFLWDRLGDMELRVVPIAGLPLFSPGLDVAGAVLAAVAAQGEAFAAGDVLVVAQKIISKAEGRLVRLSDVAVRADGAALAQQTGRTSVLAQLIVEESHEVMRASPVAIITRHKTGHVLANAGIDASNVAIGNLAGSSEEAVLLWPVDPDASARGLRAGLGRAVEDAPAVIIADSMGRAWRIGTLGTAIGCAGIMTLDDQRGQVDLFGRTLQATIIAVADAIAGMAVLAMGEGAQATPAAIVRGAGRWVMADDGPGAAAGLRPVAQDMFR